LVSSRRFVISAGALASPVRFPYSAPAAPPVASSPKQRSGRFASRQAVRFSPFSGRSGCVLRPRVVRVFPVRFPYSSPGASFSEQLSGRSPRTVFARRLNASTGVLHRSAGRTICSPDTLDLPNFQYL
jgi:hypothetical protein